MVHVDIMLTFRYGLCIYLLGFINNATKATNIHLDQRISRESNTHSHHDTLLQNSTLQVHSMNGTITEVEIHPTDTVLDFNRKMRDALGVPHDYGFIIIQDNMVIIGHHLTYGHNIYFCKQLVGTLNRMNPMMNHAVTQGSSSSNYNPQSVFQNYRPTESCHLHIKSCISGKPTVINICADDRVLDLHRKLRKALELPYNHGVQILSGDKVIVGDYINQENRGLSECGIGPGSALVYVIEKLGLFRPLKVVEVETRRPNPKMKTYMITITENILNWTLEKVLFLLDRSVERVLDNCFIRLCSSKINIEDFNPYRLENNFQKRLHMLGFKIGSTIVNEYEFINRIRLGQQFTLLDIESFDYKDLYASILHHVIANIPNDPTKLVRTPNLFYYNSAEQCNMNIQREQDRLVFHSDTKFRFQEDEESLIRTFPIFLDGKCIFQIPIVDSYLQHRRAILLPIELESYKDMLMDDIIGQTNPIPKSCKIITLDEQESEDLKSIIIYFNKVKPDDIENSCIDKLNHLLTEKNIGIVIKHCTPNKRSGLSAYYLTNSERTLSPDEAEDAELFVLNYQHTKIWYKDGQCIMCDYTNNY